MSGAELLTSKDSLTARKEELELHLLEGDGYLSEERKTAIRREIGHISFELQSREVEG